MAQIAMNFVVPEPVPRRRLHDVARGVFLKNDYEISALRAGLTVCTQVQAHL